MVSQFGPKPYANSFILFPLMQNVIFVMLPPSTPITYIQPVYGLLFRAVYLSVSSCKRVGHLTRRAGRKTYDTGSWLRVGVWVKGGGCRKLLAGNKHRGFNLRISSENLWADKSSPFPWHKPEQKSSTGGQAQPGRESKWQDERNRVYSCCLALLSTVSPAEESMQRRCESQSKWLKWEQS